MHTHTADSYNKVCKNGKNFLREIKVTTSKEDKHLLGKLRGIVKNIGGT